MALKLNGTNSVAAPAYAGDDADTGLQCGTNELKLVTGGSARATVDSSGRVLIGGTSAISGSSTNDNLQLINSAGSILSVASSDTTIGNGTRIGEIEFWGQPSSTWGRFANISAFGDGSTGGVNGNPGRLVFSTESVGSDDGPEERMRITSAGKIQVTGTRGGSLQPSDNDTLELFTSASNGAVDTGCGLTFYNNDGNGAEIGGTIQVAKENGSINNTAGYMRFSTRANNSTPAERMRITSGGNMRFGQSSTDSPGYGNTTVGVSMLSDGRIFSSMGGTFSQFNRNSNGAVVNFARSSTGVGVISVTTSSTSYGTSSDYRLKENVVALDGAIARVKQLLPKRFNFVVDADTTVDGFLAHEAQTVVPEAVTGTHDEVDDDSNPVYQCIDQSKLVPLLTAALQEAISKIETLETQNTAQQAQIDDLLARVTALEAAS